MAAVGRPVSRPNIVRELKARVSTMEMTSLGKINCMAVDSDGTLFVCTVSAIWAISQNQMGGRAGLRSLVAGHRTECGFKDGEDSEARFHGPQGIALDGDGNILVADTYNHAVRRVTRSGVVTTIAGHLTTADYVDGVGADVGYVDGVGADARFNEPWGIAVDARGLIIVADSMNNCLRMVTPGDAAVSTLVGDGNAEKGFNDGQGLSARFSEPCGIALDIDGNIVVADYHNSCIRKVDTARRIVSTLAGNAGQAGGEDGMGADARFQRPQGIAVDGDNNVLVTDGGNHRVRLIASGSSRVTTVAGEGFAGKADGPGDTARFDWPRALTLDERGHLLVAHNNKDCLRLVRTDLPWELARILYVGLLKNPTPTPVLQPADKRRSRSLGLAEQDDPDGIGELLSRSALEAIRRSRTAMRDLKYMTLADLKDLVGNSHKLRSRRARDGGMAGQCLFSMLPVEGRAGINSPILTRILQAVQVLTPRFKGRGPPSAAAAAASALRPAALPRIASGLALADKDDKDEESAAAVARQERERLPALTL